VSNDELNRKMEFIVEQQAQFASDIQRLTERQERFQEHLERVEQRQERFQQEQEGFREDLRLLAAAVASTRETAATTSDIAMTLIDRYQELAAAQTETQRTVDRLARAVLAHVGDGHGGRGPEPSPPSA
jgi:chromosome segregation ATPase